jgi:ferredoxin
MALMITAECTACDACKPVCPNEAIRAGEPYVIDALRCTECVGAEDEPQCKLVCPVADCIVPNPDFGETPAQLLEKYRALHR